MRSFQPLLLVDLLESSPSLPGVSSLVSQEVGTLESGTHAFVKANKTLYVLDKSSAINPTGGVVTALGGEGRWIPATSVGGSYGAIGVRTTEPKSTTLTGIDAWATLPGNANSFAATYAVSGGGWSLNTTTGKLTWIGPDDQPFLVTASVYGYSDTTVANTRLSIGINESAQDWYAQVSAPVATGSSSLFGMSVSGVLALDQGFALDILLAAQSSVFVVTEAFITATPLH